MEQTQKTCKGCGVILQNKNHLEAGYTPKSIEETTYCQRCFRLLHYGETYLDGLKKPNYRVLLKDAIKNKCLIIYVVDLFNFESSIIRGVHKFIKDNPILVIANKRDVLPKNVDDDKIKQFVYLRLKEEGVKIQGVITSSAYKNYNLDEIYHACKSLKNNKDIYIIGGSSVGKSTLINALLRNYHNTSDHVISTSPYPGTTINTISIPMDNDSQIIDTPGILIADSYAYTLEPHVINKIVPRSEIKPRIYQLNCKQGIIIGGLAKIKIKEGPRANYVLYASNEVEVLRCKDDKIDATFNSLIAGNKISPLSNSIKGGEDLVDHHLILPEKKIDVVIAGLMWITLKGAGQKIIVSCKKGINVVLREPKF